MFKFLQDHQINTPLLRYTKFYLNSIIHTSCQFFSCSLDEVNWNPLKFNLRQSKLILVTPLILLINTYIQFLQ